MIERTVKIDSNTQTSQRGKFARVAVDMNLEALVKAFIRVEDIDQKTCYEEVNTSDHMGNGVFQKMADYLIPTIRAMAACACEPKEKNKKGNR
ncbi:unnamed protein product [Dovyalis caffra]|uniref:Uncharacterized protein n=1 Tax=Dovyalis caffra TaxID=77055 RepID=A0AAV1RW79_9ROSI|nr:unnamed protein product [Dovyalis caffra]